MQTTAATEEWSAVATAWEHSTDYIDGHSVAATDALVGAVDVRPGDRVLELAAGPGSLGSTWSRLTGRTGRVLLSDLAPGMVAAARRRAVGLGNVDVAVLDLSKIDLPDASVDVVVCRMGLMFVSEPALALAEIRRVLAVGGRFGALTWAGVEHNPWMTCVGMAAMLNGVVAGRPPIGPGGIFSLGDPAELAELAERQGFHDVAVQEIPTTFHAESIEAHVARVSSLAGPMAAAFASATPEQIVAVQRSAAQLAADYTSDDGLALPGRALLVTGR